MMQVGTVLDVADNSGAKRARCIKVLGGTHHTSANIGEVIVVAVNGVIPNGKVKKGEVYRAVIVRSKSGVLRKDGSKITFGSNAVVLLSKQGEPIGTRVFGPVTRELRQKKFVKIISLATEVL